MILPSILKYILVDQHLCVCLYMCGTMWLNIYIDQAAFWRKDYLQFVVDKKNMLQPRWVLDTESYNAAVTVYSLKFCSNLINYFLSLHHGQLFHQFLSSCQCAFSHFYRNRCIGACGRTYSITYLTITYNAHKFGSKDSK